MMDRRVTALVIATLMLAACGKSEQSAPSDSAPAQSASPQATDTATPNPTEAAPFTVDGAAIGNITDGCIDHDSGPLITTSGDKDGEPHNLRVQIAGDSLVEISLATSADSIFGWGTHYFGADPQVSVANNVWTIDAELANYDGHLTTIHAVVDCSGGAGETSGDLYTPVADATYAPETLKRTQQVSLESELAATTPSITVNGESGHNVKARKCEELETGSTEVGVDFELNGTPMYLTWAFVNPTIPKIAEFEPGPGRPALFWSGGATAYPKSGSDKNTYVLKGILYDDVHPENRADIVVTTVCE